MAEGNKLEDLIKTGQELRDQGAGISDPRFTVWKMSVERYLTDQFGSASVEVKTFQNVPIDDWHYIINEDAESPITQYLSILQNCLATTTGKNNASLPYYTQRHGMRTPVAKTYNISTDAYALFLALCDKYNNNIAWKYPEQCPDGLGCCGLDRVLFDRDLKYEIPSLFRDYNDCIVAPRSYNVHGFGSTHEEFDQFALLDYIEFYAQNIRDVEVTDYHRYFGHHHLNCKTSNAIYKQFQAEVNGLFEKTGLLYCLTDEKIIERTVENTPLTEEIESQIAQVKEKGTRELLEEAIRFYRQPYPESRRDAVEKIWDALERLKTYYINLDKKNSAVKIVNDMADGNVNYFNLFNTEFKALTDIGNDYRIRHHETNTIDITDPRHYDYFFNRCLSLIALAIQYLQ